MDRLLDSELKGATVTNAPAEALIKSIFPDTVLPRPVSHMFSFLKSNATAESFQYSSVHRKWLFFDTQTPDLNTGVPPTHAEGRCAKFINDIGDAIATFANSPYTSLQSSIKSRVTGRFSVKPVKHTAKDLERKPDVLAVEENLLFSVLKKLSEGDEDSTITWPNIRLIVKLKRSGNYSYFMKNVHPDLANKVWAIFDQQPNRRFVPTLAILKHASICILCLASLTKETITKGYLPLCEYQYQVKPGACRLNLSFRKPA